MPTTSQPTQAPFNILLVEDDDGDVLLTKRAFRNEGVLGSLSVANDGVEALEFLRDEGKGNPRPDLILMDLNMPRMDGRETLAEIKQDPALRAISVVVLTTSDSERDILNSYDLQASCYIRKPAELDEFVEVIRAIKQFWLTVVKFPSR